MDQDLDPQLAIEQALAHLGDDDSSDSREEGEREEVATIGSGRETPSTEKAFVPSVTVSDCEGNYYPTPRQQPSSLSERNVHQQNEDEQVRLLKRVMSDQQGFILFRKFVKERCSSSNLHFWLACEQYRKTPPTERTRLRDSAKAIYQHYISSSAPQRVNLSEKTLQSIRVTLRFGSPPGANLFDAAQHEVLELLALNEFRLFISSDTMSEVSAASAPESAITQSTLNPYVKFPHVPSASSSKASSTIDDGSSTFTVDSDPGPYDYRPRIQRRLPPRSVLSRPVSTRSTMSDTDGHTVGNMQRTGAKVHQSSRVASQEEFVAQITERLLAVQKDRESLRREVREMMFRHASVTEDVDWYDHPAMRKFIPTEDVAGELGIISELEQTAQSDVSDQPVPGHQTPLRTPTHLDIVAEQELNSALEDMNIRKQHKQQIGSQSSVITDSGIASDVYSVEQPLASTSQARVRQYLQRQQECAEQTSDRAKAAICAANVLLTNVPMSDVPPMPTYSYDEYSRRQSHDVVDQWMARNESGVSSQRYTGSPSPYHYNPPRNGDDSSSCFSSELFVPPRTVRDNLSDSDFSRPTTLNRHHKRTGGAQRKARPGPTPRPGGNTVHVLYYMDNEQIPFTRKIPDRDITLGEFKEQIFARKGNYRFFFLDWCEEIGLEAHQEYISDSELLPRHKGRITGRIERV